MLQLLWQEYCAYSSCRVPSKYPQRYSNCSSLSGTAVRSNLDMYVQLIKGRYRKRKLYFLLSWVFGSQKLTVVSLHLNKIILQMHLKGVLHLWALFLKTLCIFSKNKATSDKVSYGSGQKCSKELENYSFTSVETIVVKLQWKMCENQYFPCFEP